MFSLWSCWSAVLAFIVLPLNNSWWPHAWLLSSFCVTVGKIWSPVPQKANLKKAKKKLTTISQSTCARWRHCDVTFHLVHILTHDSHEDCCVHFCMTHRAALMGSGATGGVYSRPYKITVLHKIYTVKQMLLKQQSFQITEKYRIGVI